jgi:cAMP phosphodiesterase
VLQGAGGGPSEDNVTGLLVRSTSTNWTKGSLLAIDAGCHLAAIISILRNHFPLHAGARERSNNGASQTMDGVEDGGDRSKSTDMSPTILEVGPFAGLPFPNASARANALHVLREHVSTYLITHPHLDHFSAFAINTAGLQHGRKAKCLAGLPFTVNSIKTHIFNDIIWPNLTDEDNGVGFVTFQRLTEGGNLALGEGESRGYIELCDGLAVKGFKVSHGTCASNPPPAISLPDPVGRRGSLPGIQDPSWHTQNNAPPKQPVDPIPSMRRNSIFSGSSQPATPAMYAQTPGGVMTTPDGRTIVDSTAFFIRADPSGREILVFGDVEPDSISAVPRNHLIWSEAATKIAQGSLAAVFIECSYSDSQGDSMLFGHLVPRHLVAELCTLADMVAERRIDAAIGNGESDGAVASSDRKRKRQSIGVAGPRNASPPSATSSAAAIDATITTSLSSSPAAGKQRRTAAVAAARSSALHDVEEDTTLPMHTQSSIPETPIRNLALESPGGVLPLVGLTVVVIHVKDDMRDGPWIGDVIINELKGHESRLLAQGRGLGCEFVVSKSGESYYF